MWCYGERLGGTNWELTQKEIPTSLHRPQNPKREKLSPLNLLIGSMNFLFPNQFVTFFNPPSVVCAGGGERGRGEVGGISQNFEMKNVISTHTTDFSWKNGQIHQILKIFFFFKSPDFMISSGRQPRIEKDSGFFLLSYILCSQIWLNHLMDDCHFSYITKLGVLIGHAFKLQKYLLSPDGRLLHQYAAQWHLKHHRYSAGFPGVSSGRIHSGG